MDMEESKFRGVMQEIAESKGLPTDLWPFPAPFGDLSSFLNFRLDAGAISLTLKVDLPGLPYHAKTVQAIEKLPAAHVMGQAVLMRSFPGITLMTTIAEAACATFGPGLAELLWLIVHTLEMYMRPPTSGFHEKSCRYQWSREITLEEKLQRDIRYDEARYSVRASQHAFKEVTPMISSILQRQNEFAAQLEIVKKQNDEIIHLLRNPIVSDKQGQTPHRQRYFETSSSYLKAEKNENGIWSSFCDSRHKVAAAFLLDWLELALGGHGFKRLSPESYLPVYRLEKEVTNFSTSLPDLRNCWRHKFMEGNILSLINHKKIPQHGFLSSANAGETVNSTVSRLLLRFPDSLALTAAALWSLFDNSLEPRPGCGCTFGVPGGAYLQCKEEWEGWLIWHLETEESDVPLCVGDQCHLNMRVSLKEREDGFTIQTRTPCILGWKAETRTHPTTPLWDVLALSTSFTKKREITSLALKEIQVQAQLSIPLPVNPMFGGAATFGKTHYRVSHSIDHTSLLAMESMAVATVLIYDEVRGVHLLCDGADIIELICMQLLRTLSLDESALPTFNHSTSLGRLRTWYNSVFTSQTGRQFSGDTLIREASVIISQLCETVKNVPNGSLPYWSLQEVLRGGTVRPLKPPRAKLGSWEALASKIPPLILAVGSIHKPLIYATEAVPPWLSARKRTGLFQRLARPESSGIISDLQRMRTWLKRAEFYQKMTLCRTEDSVQVETDQDFILTVKISQGGEQAEQCEMVDLCVNCVPGANTTECAHLIL